MNIPSRGSMAKTGKNVRETKQIKGSASSDSLTGSNSIKEFTTSGSGFGGPYGGKPIRK